MLGVKDERKKTGWNNFQLENISWAHQNDTNEPTERLYSVSFHLLQGLNMPFDTFADHLARAFPLVRTRTTRSSKGRVRPFHLISCLYCLSFPSFYVCFADTHVVYCMATLCPVSSCPPHGTPSNSSSPTRQRIQHSLTPNLNNSVYMPPTHLETGTVYSVRFPTSCMDPTNITSNSAPISVTG